MASYPIRNVVFDSDEQHINDIELGFEYSARTEQRFLQSVDYNFDQDNCSVSSFPDDYSFDQDNWSVFW